VAFSLGVDIGTTYTAAGLWRDGTVHSVPLGNRSNAVPSVLFLRDDDVLLIGEAASRRGVTEPGREARDFKRRMGDEVPIRLGDKAFRANELTGHLLRWVIDTVSEREGGRPDHVVLTYPAEWGDYRRGLLIEAASTAGLDDVGVLPEPVAAATWYAAQERVATDALVGVYDLGGGTFDASVVRKTRTGFEILGDAGGDDAVGGVDFDHALLRHIGAAAGVDLARFDPDDVTAASALAQLFAAVVEAKEALSTDVEAIVPVLLPGVTRHVPVTRAQFENLIRPQIAGTVGLFGQIVRRAGIEPAQLRTVLLVGGSSRIPLVAQTLRAELGVSVALDTHPKYAVSLGAAIAAGPRVEPTTDALPSQPRTFVETPAFTGAGYGQEPAVNRTVNLSSYGLTAPADTMFRLPPPSRLAPPRITDRDEVVVRTRDSSPGLVRRAAPLAVALAVLLAIAIVVILVRGGLGSGSGFGGAPDGTTSNPDKLGQASAGTAALTGQLVADPPGFDSMHAVTALPSGDLVAVGVSNDLKPRAWVRRGSQPWRAVGVPAAAQGGISGVAVARVGGQQRIVAVGWTNTGNGQRAAVWTSTNGDGWQSPNLSPDLAAPGLGELTAVVAAAGGGFLAVGLDRREDTQGDSVAFRSDNGTDWHRLAATGLDGPGPQQVRRVTLASGGQLIAVGSVLSGAVLGPAMWTSSDGVKWQPYGTVPTGGPTLWTVTQLSDGSLLTCGSVAPVEPPTVGCWSQRAGAYGQSSWQRYDVTTDPGAPRPLFIYDVVNTARGLIVAGTGKDEAGSVDAGTWSMQVQAR
jgi:molecular chaperone DnaK